MNRALIFLVSLTLTFLTISSASSASPAEWSGTAVGSAAAADVALGGHAGAGWLAVMPSKLISVQSISL